MFISILRSLGCRFLGLLVFLVGDDGVLFLVALWNE